ncbi:MAG: acyl carrier protein [Tissierellia bacterium]|nr:acyl carrier protein [Tissierellia bacterium]
MFETIRKIIAQQMDIDEASITKETRLIEDLRADSIDAAEMILNIESELDILIPDDNIMNVKTIQDILDILEKCK